MAYTPNADDAFAVYMIAMAYVDDIPLNAFAPPHLMNVKELLIKGEFYIWPKEELDVHGRYRAPLAACTYDESTKMWRVELITGEVVLLRDVGDVWVIVKGAK
jgi:hypothetical protein